MAPGQGPGGPFNPGNRLKSLRGTGRGGVQFRNTSTQTTQANYSRQSKLHSSGQSHTATTGVRVVRASVKHDHSNWIPEFWPVRTPLRTSIGASSASASRRSQQPLQSHRLSLERQHTEDLSLPDDPMGQERIAPEGFLDACFDATPSASDSAASEAAAPSLQHAFAVAPARVVPSDIAVSTFDEGDAHSSDSADSVSTSVSTSETPLAISSFSTDLSDLSAAPSERCLDIVSDSASLCDSSSIATPSIASDCRSVLDSYAANVVASIMCPARLSGHLIGRNGQTAASLQLPGARWWLTDKAWKFGGASNLRLIVIQGTPSTVADVFSRVLSHITCASPSHNGQFFKTRQGMVKAKLVLQSWLVGTVVGKGGSTIRRIMMESGAHMQVTSVMAAVDVRKQSTSSQQSDESALQIAAPSVAALSTCIRLTFEAIRKNPCYKPIVLKLSSDYKLLEAM